MHPRGHSSISLGSAPSKKGTDDHALLDSGAVDGQWWSNSCTPTAPWSRASRDLDEVVAEFMEDGLQTRARQFYGCSWLLRFSRRPGVSQPPKAGWKAIRGDSQLMVHRLRPLPVGASVFNSTRMPVEAVRNTLLDPDVLSAERVVLVTVFVVHPVATQTGRDLQPFVDLFDHHDASVWVLEIGPCFTGEGHYHVGQVGVGGVAFEAAGGVRGGGRGCGRRRCERWGGRRRCSGRGVDLAFERIPGWRELSENTLTVPEFRNRHLHSATAGLHVIANVIAAARIADRARWWTPSPSEALTAVGAEVVELLPSTPCTSSSGHARQGRL